MKDSQPRLTTSSGLKGNRGRYTLELPPPAAHISQKPELVGMRFGWVTIISPEKRWNKAWNHCYVLTRCEGCNSIQWQLLENLRRGISHGCQACSQPKHVPDWLYGRLTAAKSRCVNPHDPAYNNYGARGIRFAFPSVLEACLYLIREFGLPDRALEIDRIDTNRDYAVGNIRFVEHRTNCLNQRRTVLSQFDQHYWPYSYSVVIRKLSQGLTRDEIILDAQTSVFEKRKNWRVISARLDFMTYEMPGHITVLPYRATLSTTVDTVGRSAL